MQTSATHHLLRIFEEIRATKDTVSFIDGWREIFGTSNKLEIHRKIGLLYALADAAAKEVLLIDESQKDSVNYWRGQLFSGIQSSAISTPWKDFKAYADNHCINYLKIQAILVGRTYHEQEIAEKTLNDVESMLLEAIEEIQASSLPHEVQLFLIRRIRNLISSIQDYHITGNTAVFDQFKATVFDAASIPGYRESGAADKLSKAIEILANATTAATGITQIAKPVFKFLGLSNGP